MENLNYLKSKDFGMGILFLLLMITFYADAQNVPENQDFAPQMKINNLRLNGFD